MFNQFNTYDGKLVAVGRLGTFFAPQSCSLAVENSVTGECELVYILESNPTSIAFETTSVDGGL